MLADQRNQRLRSPRQASIATVDQPEFAPKIHAFHGEQLHFPRFDVILRKALADERNASVSRDESLDHANAWEFHTDANTRAVRPKEFVEHLPRESRLRKNQRLRSNFFESDLRPMR